MEYDPLKIDLFGLSDVFKMDLLKQLNDTMMTSACDDGENIHNYCDPRNFCESRNRSSSEYNEDTLSVNPCLDQEDWYLDTIRVDAFEEFRRNGIEQDLDEVDVFQSKLRERTLIRPVERENTVPGPADYMVQKRRKCNKKLKTVCVFCKNNNELPTVYKSHLLKDSEGRTTCPVLRRYTCPICGVPGGDEAHTIRYCPKNVDRELSPGLGLLMKSPHLSTGRLNPRSIHS